MAGALAGALDAEKVVYLTDVPGLLLDVDDSASIVARATVAELEAYIADGTIAGGMIPKVGACHRGGQGGGRTVPTCSTVGFRTCCCSSCSPTQESAP